MVLAEEEGVFVIPGSSSHRTSVRRLSAAGLALLAGLLPLTSLAAPAAAGVTSEYIVPVATGRTELPYPRTPLPNLRFGDSKGLPLSLSQLRGAVVIMNFWLSTADPCIRELVFLNRLQGNMKGTPLQVIAVNEDDKDPAAVKAFLARQKLTYLQPFTDPGNQLASTLGLRGVPTTLIIDRQGRQVMRLEGSYEWDNQQISAVILGLTREPYP